MKQIGHVYVAQAADGCKIGLAGDPRARVSGLNTGRADEARLVYATDGMPYARAQAVERRAHVQLEPLRIRGEWFATSPDIARCVVELCGLDAGEGAGRAAEISAALVLIVAYAQAQRSESAALAQIGMGSPRWDGPVWEAHRAAAKAQRAAARELLGPLKEALQIAGAGQALLDDMWN